MNGTPAISLLSVLLILVCHCFGGSEGVSHNQTTTVINRASKLSAASKSSLFQIQEIRLKTHEDLQALYFSDRNHGWLAGGRMLFKTDDGGRTWKNVDLPAAPGATVRQLVFLSPLIGWAVIANETGYVLDNVEFRAWLLRTIDGGATWTLQYKGERVSGLRVTFADERNGWLTGVRYNGSKGVNRTPFVFHTSNQGERWLDVSEGLIKINSNDKNITDDSVNDGIAGVWPSGPLSLDVITSNARIITTADGGKNWRLTDDLDNSKFPLGIRRVDKTARQRWIASSMDGDEGLGSELSFQEEDDTWVRYGLGGSFFSDVTSLSKSEFLSCGYTKDTKRHGTQQNAVVLHTDDQGSNWSIVYSKESAKSINALAAVNCNDIWAVGNDGLVLHLERASARICLDQTK